MLSIAFLPSPPKISVPRSTARARLATPLMRLLLATPLLATLLLAAPGLCAAQPQAGNNDGPDGLVGRPLEEALLALRAAGLDVVFTSALVTPDMRVRSKPRQQAPRAIAEALLRPHGLTLREGPGGRLVVVRAGPQERAQAGIPGMVQRADGEPIAGATIHARGTTVHQTSDAAGRFVLPSLQGRPRRLEVQAPGYRAWRGKLAPGAEVPLVIELDPLPMRREVIDVAAWPPRRLGDSLSTVAFNRQAIVQLPRIGDDVFRGLDQVPGTTSSERSARLNIRGGRSDEVLILLDGIELFDPFHLQDQVATVSVVPPHVLGSADLVTGGFPAEYGDRMAGVLNLSTREPPSHRRSEIAISQWDGQLVTAGRFGESVGYLAGGRYGNFDLAYEGRDAETDPIFWDAFGKVTWDLTGAQSLRIEALSAEDDLSHLVERPGDQVTLDSRFGSHYRWANHQAVLSKSLVAESTLSTSRLDRRRIGAIEDALGARQLDLRHHLDVQGLAQRWSLRLGERAELRTGFELRLLEADYAFATRHAVAPAVAGPRAQAAGDAGPSPSDEVIADFNGNLYSLYASQVLRPAPDLSLEVGLRFDENEVTEDHLLSPRFAITWALGQDTNLRAAWGHFFQSQRAHELQIADGESRFARAERAVHIGLGLDHRLSRRLRLRAEAYHRQIGHPRPRYENLFDPASFLPELEPDRLRVDAERSRSYGLELSLEGGGPRLGWLLSYTRSKVEDRIGAVWIPRSIDQTNSLSLDLDTRLGRRWTLGSSWRYHTGWPTTPLATAFTVNPAGAAIAVSDPAVRNSDRVPDYHRLDARIARRVTLGRGDLEIFLEVQNLYNRHNIRGFDIGRSFENGRAEVEADARSWGGIFPRLGVRWRF